MSEIKFKIIKTLGIVSETSRGWTKELNLISWNDKEPKFDLREWSPGHDRMSKGITLTSNELDKLKQILEGDEYLKKLNDYIKE
jgi:hypothetical protein